GVIVPVGSHAIGTAIMVDKGAMVNLTVGHMSTTGIFTVVIDLKEKSSLTLTRGRIVVGGTYGALTLSGASEATGLGTEIKA
ncbi:hypothetical protein, partial [Salmonella enterica]|uniref:hypothetical protein n=1 Tax=Salmonella enterica TaxID=28901 RepID=UPI001F1DE44B